MWPWVKQTALRPLREPPLEEVICGILFDSLPIDPVVAGAFWVNKRREYPNRMFLPALVESRVEFQPGAKVNVAVPGGHVRTWLISEDDSRLLQFQHDRFYLNWRARGDGQYPRFSGDEGLKGRTEETFADFADFCEDILGQKPEPKKVEVGKIDMLEQGTSWNTVEDLRSMFPTIAPFLGFAASKSPSFAIRFGEVVDGCELQIGLNTTLTFHADKEEPMTGVRIETTVRTPVDGDIGAAFTRSNRVANSVFAQLIPDAESHFGGLQ